MGKYGELGKLLKENSISREMKRALYERVGILTIIHSYGTIIKYLLENGN